MNKLVVSTLFCATTLLLAACGGGKSASITDGGGDGGDGGDGGIYAGDTRVEIKLAGIPRSMVSAICLDSNSNKICEATEELKYLSDSGGASIYQIGRNPQTGAEILIKSSDPAKISHFDQTVLAFPGDSKELSMQSLIDWEYTPIDDESSVNLNLGLFLGHQQNLNLLGQNGMSAEDANDASLKEIKTIISKLSDAEIKAMAEGGRAEFQDLVFSSADGGRADFQHLVIKPHRAYEIAKENRGEEKGLVNDKLVENYRCKAGEVKTVQRYGIEDVFDLSNGTEQTYPSASILADQNLAAYAQLSPAFGGGFVNYDDVNNDRFFADEIKNLPSGINSGRIYIGFKSNGSSLQHNDVVDIGAIGIQYYADRLQDLTSPVHASSAWEHQLVGASNPTTDVYWNDFGALNLELGTVGAAGGTPLTLLQYVQTNNNFDVFVQDDTAVDFITVATCSKKDPVVEITPILEKFQCKAAAGPDNETRVTIIGGTIDAFSSAADSPLSAPSAALSATFSSYPTMDYDSNSYDKHFGDTLLLPGYGYISKARISMGVSKGGSNDSISIGEVSSNDRAGFYLHGSASNSVVNHPNWNVSGISNGERILQSDFGFTMNSGLVGLNWLQARNTSTTQELDIYVQDDTSVDFVQLDLCMREKPPFIDTDGDGYSDEEEIEAGSDPKDPASTPNDLDGDGVPNEKDCDPRDPTIWEGCEPELPESCNKAIKVDLSSTATWLNASGNAPTQNNVFSGTVHANVWDPAMTWFDFGNAANTTHDLSIDFCSCGEGKVDITEMRSDNYSKITLDNGSPIVERTIHSQDTMAAWGSHVEGDATIPYSGNGVNRTLKFSVENRYGPSGGAVDGLLTFTGHLGKCTVKDVLPK